MNFEKLTYHVEGHTGVSYDNALMYWKTAYPNFSDFEKKVITQEPLKAFGEHCAKEWDSILPATVAIAMSQTNLEMRRLFFKALGIEKVFQELKPELVDEQVIEFQNNLTDINDNPYVETVQDKYQLYKIPGDKLFPEEKEGWRRSNADAYAVRCWCTTTGREYWIYVPRWIGESNDAIKAIAWTFRINITNPEYIVRQGDIIIAKASENSEECNLHHLEKEDYLKLLKSQS